MKKIALEGPINGCGDDACKNWRDEVVARLTDRYTFHNPMDFDCRGREKELEAELVAFDTAGIAASDIVLVMASAPGWGTAMAVQMAWSMHKYIIVIYGGDRPISPWLNNRASRVVRTLQDALDILGAPCTP
jgi:hypothetical protein